MASQGTNVVEPIEANNRTYKSLLEFDLDEPSPETLALKATFDQSRGALPLRIRQMAWGAALTPNENEYVLSREIGEGGMGTVYQAHQTCVGRAVALKVLKPEIASMEHAVKAFIAEGAVTAELEHPGIVPLYDLGHSELTGTPFYAMKQVHGQPWSRLIDKQTNIERIEVLLRVGDAVAFAHSRGIVHRDIKPDNVMLGDFGEVIVMDWGLAVSVPVSPDEPVRDLIQKPRATPVTESTIGGTPSYMAPELTGPDLSQIGPWSDIYLLGATLWRAITGCAPHAGKTVKECIANARINEIAEPSADASSEIGTAELVAIARKAMATNPHERHRSVLEFQSELRSWKTHAQSAAMSHRACSLLSAAEKQVQTGYHDFTLAVYTYEEALNLWPENPCAKQGLVAARVSFARTALIRGDLELADSVLNEAGGTAASEQLAAEIKSARRERACSEHHRNVLARTAEKWSLAFELSPDAMLLIRLEDAVILEANANFEKASGWPRSEAIGRSTTDLKIWVEPELRTRFISQLRESGEVQSFYTKFRRRSGEEYEVLLSACIAELEGTQIVVSNVRDISQLECETRN